MIAISSPPRKAMHRRRGPRSTASWKRWPRNSGAAAIYAIDARGLAFGASNWRRPESFIGRDYTFRPYFREALRDGEAQQFALGTASHKAGLYLATRAAAGQAVVVVKLEFDAVESAWRAAPGVTYVTDRQGVILVASRPAWRFAATLPLAAETARAERLALGVAALPPAPFARTGMGYSRSRATIPGLICRLRRRRMPPAGGSTSPCRWPVRWSRGCAVCRP
jgi:C4-dicarboxylate-specific signal transduction histidine kinase